MKIVMALVLAVIVAGAAMAADETGFLGTWVGTWERGLEHKLVVERAEGGNAVFVYRVRDAVHSEITRGAARHDGVIVGGALYGQLPSGARLTTSLSDDGGTLTGHYARDGRTRMGVFKR